ncbi:F24J5.7 [Salix koriyanagi]|uniref:F24J5.7 n=1 Tax=Salix koriyanagi TaxID=2511006 RepID=A0A9Q0WMC3_9ROSI|nr:F24J5.7 [Salix koriyanagi]
MEDLNMLAADCVVISCCCQCLILQSIIFVLLELPRKAIQKTKAYAKKKLWHRKKEKMLESFRSRDSFDKFLEGSIRIQVDGFHGVRDCESCIEEVEEVLEEFSQKGEFAFGSFWGRVGSGATPPTCIVAVQEFDLSLTTARDRCSSKFSWPQTYDRRSASCLLSNMDANGNGDHVEFDELVNAICLI